jgi:hypothetical protein
MNTRTAFFLEESASSFKQSCWGPVLGHVLLANQQGAQTAQLRSLCCQIYHVEGRGARAGG